MESNRGDVGGVREVPGGPDGTAEPGPARVVAAIVVAGGAAVLSLVPASIALGTASLQLEQVAAGLGGLAAVVGGVKLAVAAAGIAGRLWSEHTARLATAHAG